jgi:hypothetical protein
VLPNGKTATAEAFGDGRMVFTFADAEGVHVEETRWFDDACQRFARWLAR